MGSGEDPTALRHRHSREANRECSCGVRSDVARPCRRGFDDDMDAFSRLETASLEGERLSTQKAESASFHGGRARRER